MSEEPPSDKTQVIGPPAPAEAAASRLHQNALPTGARLGEFEILDLIGEGGFGIVYLAQDHSLHRKVALKEYMPALLASRGRDASVAVRSERQRETFDIGLRSFVNEARMLAQFDHPALIKVYRFWEANGTAYMVMPFLSGITLQDALKQRGEAPSEVWIRSLLSPLMEALAVLHDDKVLPPRHRARQHHAARRRPAGAARLRRRAPRHQRHDARADGDPQARLCADRAVRRHAGHEARAVDRRVRARGGRLFHDPQAQAPAGGRPADAGQLRAAVAERGGGRYSARLLQGIDTCLCLRAEDRPQSMAAMREAIGLAPGDAAVAMPAFAPQPPLGVPAPAPSEPTLPASALATLPPPVPAPHVAPTPPPPVPTPPAPAPLAPTPQAAAAAPAFDKTELAAPPGAASADPAAPRFVPPPRASRPGASDETTVVVAPARVPAPPGDVDFVVDTAEPVADISLYADVESAPPPVRKSRLPVFAAGAFVVGLIAVSAYFSLNKVPPPAPVVATAPPQAPVAPPSAPAVVAPPPAPRLTSLDAAIDAARAGADPALAVTLEAPAAAPLGGELGVTVKSATGGPSSSSSGPGGGPGPSPRGRRQGR